MAVSLQEVTGRQENLSGAPASQQPAERPANSKAMECPWCGILSLRRHERIGILEEVILPWFGFYPWECKFCRGLKYLRNRGTS